MGKRGRSDGAVVEVSSDGEDDDVIAVVVPAGQGHNSQLPSKKTNSSKVNKQSNSLPLGEMSINGHHTSTGDVSEAVEIEEGGLSSRPLSAAEDLASVEETTDQKQYQADDKCRSHGDQDGLNIDDTSERGLHDDSVANSCTSSAKRFKSEYENLVEDHRLQLESVRQSVSMMLKTLDQLSNEVCLVSQYLPSPGKQDISPAAIAQLKDLAAQEAISLPTLISRMWRHSRILTTFTEASNSLLDKLKSKHRQSRELLLAGQVELELLSKRIRKQHTETPRLLALLPHLYPKEDYEASRKAANAEAKEVTNLTIEEISRRLQTDASTSIEAQCVDSESSLSGTASEDFEEYLLNWLRFDLACRERDAADVESIKQRREDEERNLRMLKKRESDIVAKISPIEKKLQQDISVITSAACSSNQSSTVSSSALLSSSSLSFPLEAYSLPSPLFRLYSTLFSYKAINSDRDLAIKIAEMKDPKTSSGGPSFHPHHLRLQLSIDRGFEDLPPATSAKANPMLPLSLRFSYFPKLQIVTALVLIPKMIGSDSTFLGDLFFPNDDGMISPNPLHHAFYDLESFQSDCTAVDQTRGNHEDTPTNTVSPDEDVPMIPSGETTTQDKPSANGEESTLHGGQFSCGEAFHQKTSVQEAILPSRHIFTVCLPPEPRDQASAAKTIAQNLMQLEFGRAYRWTQSLAGITYSIGEGADRSFKDLLPPLNVAINAKRFIQLFRARAALRSWTLYTEESLKEKPNVIPPPGVPLPSTLVSNATTTSSCIQSVKVSTSREFLNAGGNPRGASASATYRDVHFLNVALKISGIYFTILIALPLDAREAEFLIQVTSLPTSEDLKGTSLTPFLFSLLDYSFLPLPTAHQIGSIMKSLSSLEQAAISEMFDKWDSLSLTNKKVIDDGIDELAVNIDTHEGQKARILLELLPAGCTGWRLDSSSAGQTSNNVGNSEDKRILSHYCDARLSSIQENINKVVPKAHGCRDAHGPYSRSMMLIQLVTLVGQLDRYIRDLEA